MATREDAGRWITALGKFVTYHDDWGNREEPVTPTFYTILDRLAPKLAATGPVAIELHKRWGEEDAAYSPDMLEASLGLGLTLAPPRGKDPEIELGDPFVRDPRLLAAHPTFGPLLDKAVEQYFSNSQFHERAKGMSGFAAKAVKKERFLKRMANSQVQMLLGRPMRSDQDERGLYADLWTTLGGGSGSFRAVLKAVLLSSSYTQPTGVP